MMFKSDSNTSPQTLSNYRLANSIDTTTVRVVILGDKSAGKTALVTRYVMFEFMYTQDRCSDH